MVAQVGISLAVEKKCPTIIKKMPVVVGVALAPPLSCKYGSARNRPVSILRCRSVIVGGSSCSPLRPRFPYSLPRRPKPSHPCGHDKPVALSRYAYRHISCCRVYL